MRAVTFGFTVLAALVAAGLAAIQAADAVPVTFAVLRGDGILIPIATRVGTKWTRSWPAPAKTAAVPVALDGIPKRWWGKGGVTARWHAWQVDGTTSEVAIERPVFYRAHCQQAVGLQTSLTAQPPLPPQTVQPYPKLGLAATTPIAFQRIEPIDQGAPIWAHAGTAMATAVAAAEDALGRTVMNSAVTVPHPIPAAERAKVPVRVESLYRMPLGGGSHLYYVEVTKRYGMPPMLAGRAYQMASPGKDGCALMTFAEGWFVAGPDGKVTPPKLDVLRVTSCDYDGVWLMLPLGYVADGAGPLWLAQLTAGEAESYVGLRWDPEKQVSITAFQTHGGWCEPEGGW